MNFLKFEIKGLKELEKKLKDVEKRIKETIEKEWSFTEIFTPEFMKKYTNYNSIEEFLSDSPADFKTQEAFNNRDKEKFDAFVKENTEFEDWEEFKQAAGNLLAKKELEKQGFKFK